MADRAGGLNPPAPVNGGEFLLQLLRRPPQSLPPELPPAAAAASPLPIDDRLGGGRHLYDDPGVSAVGHEIPFSPPNFSDIGRPQLPPWLFPPPQQQQHQGSGFSPPVFSPPRFSLPQFSPPEYSRPEYQQGGRFSGGNRQQMQQLGFTSGGGDRGRNFRAGDPISMARSDLSAFPGRGQVEVGNVQRKMVVSEQDGKFVNGQVVDVTGFSEFSRNSQGNHPHIERGEGFSSLMGDQRRNDAPVRRTIVEHGRPLGLPSRRKGPGHQVWGNGGAGKQNGNHGVVNGEELRKKVSRPPMTHYVKRQTMQRQFHVDGEIEYGRHSVENGRNHALESQIKKFGDDLNCENDGGEGISRGKEPIKEDVREVENLFSTFTLQDSLQLKQHADSLTVVEEHAEKNEVQVNGSRSKDFRSDFSRGKNVSSQRRRMRRSTIECRRDIRRLSPSFLLIYESLVPPEEEVAKQKQLLLLLKKLVNKEWPKAELHLYGSCANSFGVSNCDIDICLAIDDTEMSKPEILLRLADVLQSGNLQNVQALTRARVPIVKLMDPVTGISCDICINNLLAVVNTKLLRDYARIDDRLRQLAFLVKHWAKSRDVNETYQGTLSSYAYVLMCIHFLQQRRPAILPCLQEMEATYVMTVDDVECAYFDNVDKLCNFGAHNMESVAELLWAFFNYWAFEHDYANDVISVRTGGIISKYSKDWTRRIGNDRHLICIEDPFEISHDLGRVVDKRSIRILREEFERAADILQYDSNPCATLFERYVRKTTQEQELV